MEEAEVYKAALAFLDRISLSPREINTFIEVVNFFNDRLKKAEQE